MDADGGKRQRRQQLEQELRTIVLALREIDGERNITVRVAETGDLVAVLRVDDAEARALEAMLQQR